MYLKRLESVGFKSFAERINVDFVPGVTAVVGPNGSGKSNITDAIRWVLGEQSIKSLRGAKMEDIIFQGSDTRKPLNFAEVTLVLDNESHTLPLNYEEVSVTRRVYRSGESEFYINKQTCRLKDIIDLFMDSGLGREAFSIISQGKVEEILSSRAEERRVIFEEAAGVLKYKQRKKKAEFKLSETEDNLNRIEDIIYEIEQQINPLQEQAETAKTYQKLSTDLKHQEVSLLVTEIEQLHTEWETILHELEVEQATEIEMKTTIQKQEATIESDRQSIQAMDDKIEALQSKLVAITQEVEHCEGKKRVLHERLKHFSENKEKIESQKEATKQQTERLTTELTEESDHLKKLKENRQKMKSEIDQLESKLTVKVDDITNLIEEQKAEYIEYLNKQAVKRNEKQAIDQQLQKMHGTKQQQEKKTENLLVERDALSNQKKEYHADLKQQEEAQHKLEQSIQNLKSDLTTERDRLDAAQRNLSKGQQMIAQLTSRKDMLEEMKEDFQGFFHGVKSVLKAREQEKLQQIHGAIIELIDVPQQFVTAIETVLGGQAQHVVVDDEQAARKAINWLKQTHNGRATFLPMSSMKPRFITTDMQAKVKGHDGFIGVAAELIQNEPQYEQIVQYLMGNVIIAKTLKDANTIAALCNRRYRVVTLDGDVVNPGGSMSGGAKKNKKQSLFTREQDLQDMTKKLQTYEEKARQLKTRVDHDKQHIQSMETKLEESEQSLSNNQASLNEIRHRYKQAELSLDSINDQLHSQKQNNEQQAKDEDELKAQKTEINATLTDIKQQLATIQSEIDQLTEQETNFESEKSAVQNTLHQFQVKLAEQEERIRNQQDKTNELKQQLDEARKQYDRQQTELVELLSIQQTEETAAEMDQLIQEKTAEKQSVTEQIQTNRSERLNKTQMMEDKTREIKEVTKQHDIFLKKIQEKEVKANRLDVDLENKLSQLQTDYTITFEKARDTFGKTDDVETTNKQVNRLKQSIQELGTVNIGAIDEFERLSERYTFLTEQQTDLVEAKQTLYDVIAEMDAVMNKNFSETFAHISKEFTIVFKALFGGGKAELNLTDPSNMLDTGIDIIAQPPGKKLQHLGLLSGGERALTAIALLFAILRVRPVPFCVLDEVEAALDEANVSRFAQYVKLHSKNTQFIVITHRKGTMEEADVLYGVTMAESGVSRFVSVKLEATDALVNA
ncbi:MAG TPA: chromosome segregation protein SMC [Virgibacillus sp.]|nr:chromosome segregation protein SMC [Virgibacillus sp.]